MWLCFFSFFKWLCVKVDFGKVMARLRRLRADISPADSADRFAKLLGVDVFLGEAAFIGTHLV